MITDELRTRGRMPLALPGWDDYSVWGCDEVEGCLFAQLWMNSDSPRDQPRLWITPSMGWPATATLDELVRIIATAISHGDDVVRQAMARSAPATVKAELLGASA